MLQKLDALKDRFEEVAQLIVQPEAMADMKNFSKLSKEYKDLEKIVTVYDEYKNVLENIKSSKSLLDTEKDPDFIEMAKEELHDLQKKEEEFANLLKELLIPKDPNDEKNVILEVRSGTGGDEASIFAGDLFRMYQRFAEKKKWAISISDFTEGTSGGYNKIVANISGNDVYGSMKFESGVHRVQRVPATETQGRVHTSAASVAVLPEIEDVAVDLDMNDIRKDLYCASGPGGQSVNTTYSAVRLTHNPSGIVVQCQDQKSQMKNFDKALKELRSRIYAMELAKREAEVGAVRKSMVGSGDRSDKIRTYNYPQSRVTDHRIGFSVQNLSAVMNGELEPIIEQLRIAENAEKMQSGQE